MRPDSIPTFLPAAMPALGRENPPKSLLLITKASATTSPSKYRRKKPSPSAREEQSLSCLSALSFLMRKFFQTGAPAATSTDRGRRLQGRAGTGGSLSITDGDLSGNHHNYCICELLSRSVNVKTK